MSVDKRVALGTLGARVIIAPNVPPSDPDNFRTMARRLADEHGWYLTDQFNNSANVQIHALTTGREILAQTGGQVGAFVSGAGTGGTLSGVAACLKEASPATKIILADSVGLLLGDWAEAGRPLGCGGAYALEGIGANDPPNNPKGWLLCNYLHSTALRQISAKIALKPGILWATPCRAFTCIPS